MSSGVGSFVFALFCAARKISLSRAIASSSAAMLLSRPTKSWLTMCGNTMMSRRGSAGSVRRGPWPLPSPSCLKNIDIGLLLPDAGFLVIDDERRIAREDRFVVHDDFLDALLRRHVVHDVEHRLFHDGAQAAGA